MINKLYSAVQKPRAIIFCEKKFSALNECLKNYIKSIVCNTIPFCNQCEYCQKVDSGTYRDLIIFDGSKQAIKKDDIVFIQDQFNLAPFEKSGKKIYVLMNVDNSTTEAMNSLLKFIEEPPKETYAILTTKNISKVIPTIRSRCQVFAFNQLDVQSFMMKIINILNAENVKSECDDIADYINHSYPDLRKCINLINQNIVDGKLLKLNKDDALSVDRYKSIFDYLKGKANILETQKVLTSTFKDEEFEYCYKILYNNIKMIAEDVNKWDKILLIIANYLVKNETVAFKDINLMACLTEIKSV